MVPAAQERLDGWKSIAAYLKRTTRTVQRWEKLEGLPVHRMEHATASTVFAYPEEIDAWWNERRARLEPQGTTPVPSEDTAEETKRRPRLWIAAAAMAAVAVIAGGWSIATRRHPRFAKTELVTPVNHGNAGMAAISPDGKTLIYTWDLNNLHTLTVRSLVSGEERILTQGTFSRYFGLSFTRDGATLYFTAEEPGRSSALYRIALAGGSVTRILEGVDSPVSFSPDDQRMAFVREGKDSQILVANPDGSGLKQIASRKLPEYLDYPIWSPDGKVIVASWQSRDGTRLVAMDAASGAERTVGNQVWNFVRFPVWVDRNTLAMSLRVTRRASERLYLVSYPEGTIEPLNVPGNRFKTLSASADGRSLAGVMWGETSSIWAGDGSSEPREIMAPVVGTRGIGWNGNGQLLFGPRGISSVKSDGTELTRIVSGIEFSSFTVCGTQRLVYSRSDPPNVGLWQTALPGGASKLLVAHSNEGRLHCSPDGEWVLYSERWSPAYQVASSGGTPQMLIKDAVLSPVVSWDNRWIAAYRSGKSGNTGAHPDEIAIYGREGGEAVKVLPLESNDFDWTPLRWTSDSRSVGYIEKQAGVANVWLQPIDGSPRRQLTHFKGGRVIDFDWSKDGHIAVEFGTVARDVFLVRDAAF